MASSSPPVRRFAVCIRNRVAAVVLIVGDQVIRLWRRHFAYAAGRSRVEYLSELLSRLREQHVVHEIVVEPDSDAHAAALSLGFVTYTVRLCDAKASLLGGTSGATTHRELVEYLVDTQSVLAAQLTRMRSGRIPVAPGQRWQTIIVLAAALGLATQVTPSP